MKSPVIRPAKSLGGNRTYHKGFSVVELMIALAIGLLITVGIVQIFLSSRATYTLTEGYGRAQESGRFGVEFVSYDLRMAGYMGCLSNLQSSDVGNIVDPPSDATDFIPEGFRGFAYKTGATGDTPTDWIPTLPDLGKTTTSNGTSVTIKPLKGSDLIMVQYAAFGAQLRADKATTAEAQVDDNEEIVNKLGQDDVAIVADCEGADMFRVTNLPNATAGIVTFAHANSGNNGNTLSKMYGTDAELLKLLTNVYFVARRGNEANNPPSLWRINLAENSADRSPEELVTGVEMLRLLYGRDTSGDGVTNVYETADEVAVALPAGTTDCPGVDPCPDWDNVVAVRIGLVLNSGQENVDVELDKNVYSVLGEADTFDDYDPPDDNRRRRVFTASIQPRN